MTQDLLPTKASPRLRRPKLRPPLLVAISMVVGLGVSSGVARGDSEPTQATTQLADTRSDERPTLPVTEVPDGFAQAEDRTYPPPIELDAHRDADGTIWRAITRDSNEGRCIEVEAVSGRTGQRLGMLGGCGLPAVDYDDRTGFRPRHDEALLLPITGTLDTGSATATVLLGIASCNCNLWATFSDGTALGARARKGFFLVRRDGTDATVARIEALDEAGRVLTSHDLSTAGQPPIVGDLLSRRS